MLTTVYLPGNMCDARLWSRLPDFGSAGAPAVHANLTCDDSISKMARRALAQVDGPLLLIGFSLGAIVAVDMAVQAPDRIAGLVLAGYNATADLPDRAAHRPVQQAEVRASYGKISGLERVLVDELKPNYLGAAHRGDAALLALLRDMGMKLGADVFVRRSEALRLRADRVAAIAALDVPTLYLCGAEDALCPPEWHRRWAAMTPKARIAEIANAGHMLPLEAPAAFAAAVDTWITENERIFVHG